MLKKILSVFWAFIFLTGCLTTPKIEGNDEAKIDKLEAAGKEIEVKKIPWIAGTLNAVIPGTGQMYTGDWGDGFITLFFFWTVYHYIFGIVDAVQEARVQNIKYTIQKYTSEGFNFSLLNEKQNEASRYALIDRSTWSL